MPATPAYKFGIAVILKKNDIFFFCLPIEIKQTLHLSEVYHNTQKTTSKSVKPLLTILKIVLGSYTLMKSLN